MRVLILIAAGLAFATADGVAPPDSVADPASEALVTASILGPTSVRPDSFCSWQADVSGGTPPYTYEWTKNGQSVGGNSEWVNIYADPETDIPGFRIGLQVTDDVAARTTLNSWFQ